MTSRANSSFSNCRVESLNHFGQLIHRDPVFVFSLISWLGISFGLVLLQVIDPLGIYHCPFKAFVGLPCFTCGVTRMLVALSNFSFSSAFGFQPLGLITLCLLLFYGPVIYLFDSKLKVFSYFRRYTAQIVSIYMFFIGVNWIYLVWAGV